MNTNPLVSIVIPIYNEEKYLQICIESVLSQTYSNWECIILNNCSADSSLNIAKKYEAIDCRIKVYSNSRFLSMVENHNQSLKYISPSSKYCKMVLGDDWIFRDCIEKMVELAESDQSIGIVGSFRLCGRKVEDSGLPIIGNSLGKNIFNGRDVCKMQLMIDGINYIFGTQTTVLYTCETIRNRIAFFDESSLFWDAEVCFDILKDKNFGFIYQVLSFTRRDNDSITSSMLEYGTWMPAKMRRIVKYGKEYLNDQEYNKRYSNLIEEYHSYLGWKLFTQHDKNFWDYHEKELNELGIRINKIKLYKYSAIYFVDKMLNPKRTVEEIIKRKSRKSNMLPNGDIVVK